MKVPGAFESGVGQRQDAPLQVPYQNGSVSADAFGAGVGRNLQQAGEGLQQGLVLAKRIQDEEDRATGYDTYSKLSEQAREYLYNPDQGLYTRKGAQALGAYKQSLKTLDDLYTKSTEKLSNGAKERVTELWRTKRENLLDGISKFEVKERNDYKAQSTEATLKTSVSDAIENYNNQNSIADSLAIGEVALRDSMAGAPAEAVKMQVEAFRSDVHKGVINRYLSENDPLGAKTYMEKVQKQLDGQDVITLKKLVDAGEKRTTAQVSANEIMARHDTYEAQVAAASKIKDEDVRSEVMDAIDTTQSRNAKVSAEQRKELSGKAWDTVIASGDKNSIPIQEWVALDEDTKREIKAYTMRGGEEAKTDPARWAELYRLYEENPRKFADMNLTNEINKLSTADFKDFTKKQQDLIKGDTSDQLRTRTDLAIANDRLKQIGIDPNAKAGKADANKTAMFFRALDQRKQLFFEDNNRKPREDEVEKIIDDLTMKITFDPSGLFNSKTLYGFETDGTEDPATVEVPNDVREKMLKDYYEVKGMSAEPPTEEMIRRAYVAKLSGKKGK